MMSWLIQRHRSSTTSDTKPKNESLGHWITKINGHNVWEMEGSVRDQWVTLAAEIKTLLDEQSDPVRHSVIWSAYMVGRTEKTAKPTVMFCSRDAPSRKSVRELIRTSMILDKYPTFVTAERSCPPDFDRLVPLWCHRNGIVLGCPDVSNGMVYATSSAGEWKKATIGGVICCRRTKFYFTVAHIFTEVSEFTAWSGLSNSQEDFEIDNDENEILPEEDDFAAITSTGSISPILSTSDEATSSFTSSLSGPRPTRYEGVAMDSDERDTPEVRIRSGPDGDLIARHLLPSSHSINLDNLSIPGVTVGQISRERIITSTDGRYPSLDYAILEVPKEETGRADRYAITRAPVNRGQVRPLSTDVVAVTGRNTRLRGRLVGTPSFLSGGTAKYSQELWKVRLNGEVLPGDCGLWVVDARTRELYGHLVAGDTGAGTGYIIPAYQVFSDLQRRLGHISLPAPRSFIATLFQSFLKSTFLGTLKLDITLVGLQNSGKTSLLRTLAGGEFTIDSKPTIGFDRKQITKGNVAVTVFDLGGQPRFRSWWEKKCRVCDGIVFVVDAADLEMIDQARDELHSLLSYQSVSGIPLLVLGNKHDLLHGVTIEALYALLDLKRIQDREGACYSVSAKEGTNMDYVLQWLIDRVKHKKEIR